MFVTWFDFYSDKFVYQCIILNLFLWIFRVFMGFYRIIKIKFSSPEIPVLASACRPDQSTELEVGRPTRSNDVHKRARQFGWRAGRPTRSTARELMLSGKPRSTGPVDRQRALLSVPGHGRPGRSTEAPTVRNLTVGGRPARSTDSRQG